MSTDRYEPPSAGGGAADRELRRVRELLEFVLNGSLPHAPGLEMRDVSTEAELKIEVKRSRAAVPPPWHSMRAGHLSSRRSRPAAIATSRIRVSACSPLLCAQRAELAADALTLSDDLRTVRPLRNVEADPLHIDGLPLASNVVGSLALATTAAVNAQKDGRPRPGADGSSSGREGGSGEGGEGGGGCDEGGDDHEVGAFRVAARVRARREELQQRLRRGVNLYSDEVTFHDGDDEEPAGASEREVNVGDLLLGKQDSKVMNRPQRLTGDFRTGLTDS